MAALRPAHAPQADFVKAPTRGDPADIALERNIDVTHVVVTVSLTHHRKTDFATRLIKAEQPNLAKLVAQNAK
ncbi:hypothetical protein [Roseovarius sp.]|uniref:hypothetical protein n=1 Tax=Roseovarius sp. TaxID=1486281 RepID=UPI00356A7F8D